MAKQSRSVFVQEDGQWANQRDGASRAGSVHGTQKEAIAEARRMLERAGGGELTIMGRDGEIRSKRTIGPAHDPEATKG